MADGMIRLAEEEKTRALALFTEILEIPTVNGVNGEAPLAEYLMGHFKDRGIDAFIQPVEEGRANVIADVKGGSPEKILLNGHLDTVPYGDLAAWDTDPAAPVIKDGRLFARGSSDMKSGLAAYVFTLCLMAEKGKRPRFDITFIGTCNEENGGSGAQKIMEAGLLDSPELILIGEPTDMNLGAAQKGCFWVEFAFSGKTSHGAYPWEGVNAFELGFRLLSELKAHIGSFTHPLLGAATGEITIAECGVAPNMVPDSARFVMDIRNVPGLPQEDILQKARGFIDDYSAKYPGFGGKLKVINQRPALDTTEFMAESPFVRELRETAGQILGESPADIGINYYTDGSILSQNGRTPVILFGPGTPSEAHKPNESLVLERYFETIEILVNLLYGY